MANRPARARVLLRALAAIAPIAAVGCGPTSEFPETVPVRGTVSYRGEPLDRGTITFISPEGHVATGEIQPDGTYRLSTFAANDGAVPGRHRVQVVADTADPSLMPGSSPGYEAPRDLIPPKYRDANTSGLVAEVSRDTPEIDFDLD